MEEFESLGSGWRYTAVRLLQTGINKVEITRSGSSFIKLPVWIQRKNAVINIANFNDNFCFIYCVLAALFPAISNYERPEAYPKNFNEHFNLDGLEFPMKLSKIGKFEKQNPTISINVFGEENEQIIGPLYHTKCKKKNHINLLLLHQDENSHFCLITDLSKLIGSSVSSHKAKKYVCDSCLNHFYSLAKFQTHERDCSLFKPVKIVMPETKEAEMKFSSHKALLRRPFVIAADFECLTMPIENSVPTTKSTFLYQKHIPFAVAFTTVCSFDDKYNNFHSHHGEDAASWFISKLELECERIREILLNEEKLVMLPLTDAERESHMTATQCFVCASSFTDENIKIAHHDHYSGKFAFTCCNMCNLKIQKQFTLPVFFHNLSGYDAHLFIRELAKKSQVSIIPNNTENYISFSAWFHGVKLIFLDSFRFLPEKLEQLAANLDPSQLKITRRYFSLESDFELVRRKGVFPYDYMNAWEKLRETDLPDEEQFFSQLSGESISKEEYEHAKKVFSHFNCKHMLDYSMLYLKTDVLLLADVIENFRDLTMKYYGLDAAGFYTTPGLSLAAAFLKTKARIELFTDIEYYLFIIKSLRGGNTQSIHRYAEANNKFLPDFDINQPISYLLYLDFNSLYGWALAEKLPVSDFRFLLSDEIAQVERALKAGERDYSRFLSTCEKGFILEVDLEYPESIHDAHNEMPFCVERAKPPNCTQSKLLGTLTNKEKYVIHVVNLIQCLEHGLVLKKIHRVLEFTEKAWLKDYIDLNTKLRSKATSKFEKNLFKLFVNSLFGKSIESDHKKRDIKIANNWKQARKMILQPNFLRSTIVDENFVIIEFKRTEITITKMVSCGYSVLELSKTKMYDFYYNYVCKKFASFFHHKLLYIDTDSQVLHFTLKDHVSDKNFSIYDLIRRDALTHFDTSDYPADNVCGIPLVNCKKAGYLKDELNFRMMKKWISLRPKMYCMTVEDNIFHKGKGNKDVVRKVKGVGRSAANQLSFNDFYNCLFNDECQKASFNTIQSKNHQIYTVNINKYALTNSDNKRFICEDKISSLAYGHYKLKEME